MDRRRDHLRGDGPRDHPLDLTRFILRLMWLRHQPYSIMAYWTASRAIGPNLTASISPSTSVTNLSARKGDPPAYPLDSTCLTQYEPRHSAAEKKVSFDPDAPARAWPRIRARRWHPAM